MHYVNVGSGEGSLKISAPALGQLPTFESGRFMKAGTRMKFCLCLLHRFDFRDVFLVMLGRNLHVCLRNIKFLLARLIA